MAKFDSLLNSLHQPIEQIFDMINYVIKLNNLPKFGFEKISRDGDTYTQYIKSSSFYSFLNFLYIFF